MALSVLLSTAQATNYHIDSQYGNTAVANCENVNSIWGECNDTHCSGAWENVQQLLKPCLPGMPQVCTPGPRDYVCRRVSGGYAGWDARNGMLDAYFKGGPCWFDLKWFFYSQLGTHEWTALRGDDGSWINMSLRLARIVVR